jgi:3-hydroxyacyl-CoA dehydrogenase/3a,7a,12a-trihydroxy-5b-cholest-24-enoyl-CoA hydratase
MDSFTPIMANLKTAEAGPGSEVVDLNKALGYNFEPKKLTYQERDVSLYALAVGAAADPLDARELPFVYELDQSDFKTLPTFAVTFPFVVMDQITSVPGLKFNPMMLLHGEQYLVLRRPLPTQATLTNEAKISHIYDKGTGALVMVDVRSVDENGEEVAFNQSALFIRGIGGFGGERGPAGDVNQPPDRPPDAVQQDKTRPNQALLYRLASGDRNPLHVDPAMAAVGGFDRPILHGLCTLGFAGRAVLKHFADNDPTRFKSIKARFSKHVFPGETIVTDMWQASENLIIFQSRVAERDEVVLSNAAVELYDPDKTSGEKKGQSVETPGAAPIGGAPPKSLGIFDEIAQRIGAHPEWVEQVNTVYQFNITGHEGGVYVVDLKNRPGSVYPGENRAAECSLTIAYDDFVALMKGELNPQVAFMAGKLKIGGDIIRSARLTPLFSVGSKNQA